jgi:hypothetical protein
VGTETGVPAWTPCNATVSPLQQGVVMQQGIVMEQPASKLLMVVGTGCDRVRLLECLVIAVPHGVLHTMGKDMETHLAVLGHQGADGVIIRDVHSTHGAHGPLKQGAILPAGTCKGAPTEGHQHDEAFQLSSLGRTGSRDIYSAQETRCRNAPACMLQQRCAG